MLDDLVDTVLASIGGIIVEDFLIFFDEVVTFFETGNIKSEMVSGGLIHTEHLKRSSRATLFVETVNLEALRLGIMSENLAEIFRITMEVGNDGAGFCEKFVEFILGKLAVNGPDSVVR